MNQGVEETVISAIRTVLQDTGRGEKGVKPEMLLSSDLGFDSLDMAQAVVLLERSLGVDPFRAPSAVRSSIRTVADLVKIYSQSISGS